MFGRDPSCDLPLGVDPVDDYVSRSAGSLTALADGLLVRNTSSSKTITMFALPGPEIPVRPGAAVGTMPYGRLQLVIPSRFGHRYVLYLGTPKVPQPRTPAVAPRVVTVAAATATASGADQITPREHRMLTALCAPLLTEAGGEPATYRRIAEQVGTTPQTVKTCLDRLRARLSDVEGIPGLRAGEDDQGVAPNYLTALAWWAIDTGAVQPVTARGRSGHSA